MRKADNLLDRQLGTGWVVSGPIYYEPRAATLPGRIVGVEADGWPMRELALAGAELAVLGWLQARPCILLIRCEQLVPYAVCSRPAGDGLPYRFGQGGGPASDEHRSPCQRRSATCDRRGR
jgi:hypothetical protein